MGCVEGGFSNPSETRSLAHFSYFYTGFLSVRMH